MLKVNRSVSVVSILLITTLSPLLGQNVVFIGDAPGGNHRSEARTIATFNNGTEFLVVGGSEGERGWELTTFTSGNGDTPPELFIHPDPDGSIITSNFKVISDITPDGQLVVGRQENAQGQTSAFLSGPFGENFIWLTAGGDVFSRSRATGISDDGSIIVGTGRDESNVARAVYWDETRAIHFLPIIEGFESFSWAYEVSADGSVLIGFAWQWDEAFNIVAETGFVWTEANGMQLLGPPDGIGFPEPLVISQDGTLTGGSASLEDGNFIPVYWTLNDLQPHRLLVPEGYEGGFVDSIAATNDLITGYLVDSDFSQGGEYFTAVIWNRNEPESVIFFKEWAESFGCSFNGAWPTDVSIHSDGETFYGLVYFPETEAVEGYVVQIEYAPTDLTIIGRLPYPNNRTINSVGDGISLRDINPAGTLAGGQGNFYESETKQLSLPVYWTPETGLREISPLAEGNPDEWWGRFGRMYDVTPGGDAMVGQGFAQETWGYGFLWEPPFDPERLPVSSVFTPVPEQIVFEESRALGMSDDGSLIVGQANARGRTSPNRAATWSDLAEVELLPGTFASGQAFSSFATDVSADGSTIHGWAFILTDQTPQGYISRSAVWKDRVPMELSMPEGYLFTDSWHISHDGSTVAGTVYNLDEANQPVDEKGILWNTSDGSFELLDPVPEGWDINDLHELNWDGSMLTGTMIVDDNPLTFVWDRSRGLFETKDYLETVCGLSIGPYVIQTAHFNDEGTHLVGQLEGKFGEYAFFIELPEEFQPEAAKYLWRYAPPREDPYRFIDGFGWLYDNGTYPWVWHTEHGWIYTIGSDPSKFLMFDASLQAWWQVSMDNYPWMFKSTPPAAWYYYYAPYGSPGERFFYDPSTGQSQLESVIFNSGG
jgi:uncharacterized membrane protein